MTFNPTQEKWQKWRKKLYKCYEIGWKTIKMFKELIKHTMFKEAQETNNPNKLTGDKWYEIYGKNHVSQLQNTLLNQ